MTKGTIFIVSDGTGETAATMVRAAIVHYTSKEIHLVRCKNIRSESQIKALIEDAALKKAVVVYTLVSPELRSQLQWHALQADIETVDLLSPLFSTLNNYLGQEPMAPQVGVLRSINESYFRRIDAIEYTVKHDDGRGFSDLTDADIILVGISRTSKTPLSIFLSHKGWRVANIPIVLGTTVPAHLKEIDQRKIIGLTIEPETLFRIRKNRLEKLGSHHNEYASLQYIQKEIEFSQSIFKQNRRWPVLDVTGKALEETAAEITQLISSRLGLSLDERYF